MDGLEMDYERIVRINCWAAFWRDHWSGELPFSQSPLFNEILLNP